MIRFKNELDSKFKINNKIIIDIRIANIFIDTNNNNFE